MKRSDEPSTPANGRLLVSLAARLAVVLAVAFAVDQTGFGGAIDDVLRQQYYGLRGQRDSTQQVILVAIDAPTVAAWGPPHWRSDQLASVFAAIAKGKPSAIGIVDETPRILPPNDKPPAGVITGPLALVLDDDTVEAAVLSDGTEPTVAAKVLATAGIADGGGSALAINFVGKRG